MTRGLHLDDLGTPALTWVELRSIIRYLPAGNALARERNGEAASWTSETYLLALIADLLAVSNWQRAGDKHAKRPVPVERPTLPGTASAAATQGTEVRGRGKGMTIEQMRATLGWEAPDAAGASVRSP